MLGQEQEVKVNVYGDHSIAVKHYLSKRSNEWRTCVYLPDGMELRTLNAKQAIALSNALLKSVAMIEGIESGAGNTPEGKIFEDLDLDTHKIEIWLRGNPKEQRGWTADVYTLETGHFAYCLTMHKGPNYTYSRLIHGAYEDQYHALQAAILEFRTYTGD
jgi:hypothetical protein